MLISAGSLTSETLRDQVAVVTGAGRGIGLEAALALAWLGARVVIAELDGDTGRAAAQRIESTFGDGRAMFIRTDVGSQRSVRRLRRGALRQFGRVDVVINNATITPMGAVADRAVSDWDASYRVNLRGPVLLAQAFLPDMIRRDYGVFVCVSSVGLAYMGAYETFKAAQAHLAQTLDAEMEGTNVHCFAIGPGLVRTPGALAGIRMLAPMYGKSVEEFIALSEEHIISAEAAGAGFAAAVALAEQFRGQEISSVQALLAAGISLARETSSVIAPSLDDEMRAQALAICAQVQTTLARQAAGWQERSLFERQWMVRDFKKNAGMPVEGWLDALKRLEQALRAGTTTPTPLHQLADFYAHLQALAAGYEKDPRKLAGHLEIIRGWQQEVEQLQALLQPGAMRER